MQRDLDLAARNLDSRGVEARELLLGLSLGLCDASDFRHGDGPLRARARVVRRGSGRGLRSTLAPRFDSSVCGARGCQLSLEPHDRGQRDRGLALRGVGLAPGGLGPGLGLRRQSLRDRFLGSRGFDLVPRDLAPLDLARRGIPRSIDLVLTGPLGFGLGLGLRGACRCEVDLESLSLAPHGPPPDV